MRQMIIEVFRQQKWAQVTHHSNRLISAETPDLVRREQGPTVFVLGQSSRACRQKCISLLSGFPDTGDSALTQRLADMLRFSVPSR